MAVHFARHLSRLFRRHLGASPLQTATSIRLHRAKSLLEETNWQTAEVAYRTGFKSLRRFNAAFAGLYRRPPSDFRKWRVRVPGDEAKRDRAAA